MGKGLPRANKCSKLIADSTKNVANQMPTNPCGVVKMGVNINAKGITSANLSAETAIKIRAD